MNFKELQEAVHKNAINHGWWEEDRNVAEIVSLCHCELSEAVEEYRKGKRPDEVYYRESDGKPEGVPVELADTVIRIMDFCGRHKIDLWAIMKEKHEFNKTRSYKHGNKKI